MAPQTTSSVHTTYLRQCLTLASKSPPRPTNFRIGAILLSRRTNTNPTNPKEKEEEDDDDEKETLQTDRILSTGYTMELTGNTHAEQCCLSNYASVHSVPDERVAEVLPDEPGRELVMYVTMEPCGKRLSGNLPCVWRIVGTRTGSGAGSAQTEEDKGNGKRGIQKVYFGVKEPATFVGESEGCRVLSENGVQWEVVPGLEREILETAFAGHEDREGKVEGALRDIGVVGERQREQGQGQAEEVPSRNPKKRMMEGETMV